MASQPIATLHQEPLSGFILIRTDEVDFDDRLRPVDKPWAEALGAMMARDGQDTPIKVCRLPGRQRWTGVVGAHRHAGAVQAGIEYLKAEVTSANLDDRRLVEIRENLFRSDLSPLDRAAFVAEAVAIHKRRAGIDPSADGRAVSAAVRWQKAVKDEAADATATIAVVYGFTDQVAHELGLSKRTIEGDLMLYKRLPASLVERLRTANHPVMKNASQLRAIAKLDPAVQADVLKALVGDGGWQPSATVAEAVKRAQPGKVSPVKSPDQKRLNTFLDTFSRMGMPEKRGALVLLRDLLPPGFAIVEGDGRTGKAGADQ
jgi:ParB family chromosome partitioning protein